MQKYVFPRLFIDTNNGKIRFWEIRVEGTNGKAEIYTKYGIDNGKIIEPYPQIIKKTIRQPNFFDRAVSLAFTKWENMIHKGYKHNEKVVRPPMWSPTSTKTKPLIPMRAYLLEDHRVEFPAYVQPKLDGYRALLHKKKSNYQFFSNTQREYHHLEHLNDDLKKIKILDDNNIYLDGELYLEDEHVNVLRSILSSKELDDEKKKMAKKIKYYVFDMFDLSNMDLSYEDRYKILQNVFKTNFNNIVLTPTTIVKNKKDIENAFAKYVKEGYEGIIVRNKRGKYKLKSKSIDVLKSKNIMKNEFIIVGYKEAKGNNRGTVIWEIRCKNDPRKSFWAKPMGTREERRMMYKDGEKYIGKTVMVKYFEIDKDGCVSKNPVAFF